MRLSYHFRFTRVSPYLSYEHVTMHVALEKLEYKFIVDQSNYVEISILKLYMKINISQIVCIILSFFINYKKLHKFFVNFSFSLSTINRFILDICTQVLSTILVFWSIYVLICIFYFFLKNKLQLWFSFF